MKVDERAGVVVLFGNRESLAKVSEFPASLNLRPPYRGVAIRGVRTHHERLGRVLRGSYRRRLVITPLWGAPYLYFTRDASFWRRRSASRRTYLTESVYKPVSHKSVPIQIRRIILRHY